MNAKLPKQITWACRRLKAAREMRQMTLKRIGEKLGVQRAFISNIEHARKEPQLSTIVRYAEALDLNLETLFEGCPDSDGARYCPSNSELRLYAKRFGITDIDFNCTYEGDWHLADEIYWAMLVQGFSSDTDQVALWVRARIWARSHITTSN